MKVRALRGVCLGPGSHLAAGDVGETDAATGQFLVSIRAVEIYTDPPPAADAPESETVTPAKPGKKEKSHA
jgi:hypothetical protein